MAPAQQAADPGGSLAGLLRSMRETAVLTQEQLAGSLGWAPSKISKIENRHQLPSPDDVRSWARITNHPEEIERALGTLDDAESVRRQTRNRIRGGNVKLQQDMNQLTETASLICEFEVAIIPALLQTAGYAQAVAVQMAAIYGTTDIDATVRAKLERQRFLYTKRCEFIITEAALRLLPCPVQVMLGQIDRLLSVLDLDNISLGIVPMNTELAFGPFYGFYMLDKTVISEDFLGRNDGGAVAAERCSQIFGALTQQAVTGAAARDLIMAVRADLQPGPDV